MLGTLRAALFIGLLVALVLPRAGAGQVVRGLTAPTVAPTEVEASSKPAPETIIADVDIHAHALALRARLRAIRADAQPRSAVDRVEAGLAGLREIMSRDRSQLSRAIGSETDAGQLDYVEQRWAAVLSTTTSWDAVLSRRGEELQALADELRQSKAVWTRTRDAKREEPLAPVLVERIKATLTAIAETEDAVVSRRDQVWRLADEALELQLAARDALDRIDELRRTHRTELTATTAPPLWSPLAFAASEGGLAGAARSALASYASQIRFAVLYYTARIAWHVVVFVVLALLFSWLRRRSAEWDRSEPALEATFQVLARPIASAAVAALLLSRFLYPLAPSSMIAVVGLLALVSTLRILPRVLPAGLSGRSYWLGVLYLATQLVTIDARDGLFGRVVTLAIAVLAAVGLVSLGLLVRRGGFPALVGLRERVVSLLIGLGFGLLVLAIGLEVVGKTRLATFLTLATVRSAFHAIFFFVGGLVLSGSWIALMRSPLARGLRSIVSHGERLKRSGLKLIPVALAALWVVNTLRLFEIEDAAWQGLRSAFTASLEIRNLRLSLGMLASFVGVLWAASLLSRVIRLILEEDVLPRLSLARGVPQAVSVTLRYLFALLAFIAALAATGVELSSFTILGGAFGIGLAFGMQNIVNNFVSGLILLYERPIRVGDTIEVGTMMGEVRQIGIRSSIMRTWDGADIIVPNGDLIAREVTNWTRSDRRRRIQIKLGVAYGSDPTRVIGLLEEVGARHEKVLRYPAPLALFMGFGESALDFELRVWTDHFDDWVLIRSQLHVEIARAMAAAGIVIPFPQRDVHLIPAETPAGAARHVVSHPAGAGGST